MKVLQVRIPPEGNLADLRATPEELRTARLSLTGAVRSHVPPVLVKPLLGPLFPPHRDSGGA